jgi:hypothetical protein
LPHDEIDQDADVLLEKQDRISTVSKKGINFSSQFTNSALCSPMSLCTQKIILFQCSHTLHHLEQPATGRRKKKMDYTIRMVKEVKKNT